MIIYLHGFNSAYDPENEKVKALSQLGEVTGITYDSYDTFDNIFKEIKEKLPSDLTDVVLVGTSLGGFWAATIAKFFGLPSVIINPCYDPSILLSKYVGITSDNYQTGRTNCLSDYAVKSYKDHQLMGMDDSYSIRPLVLLDMADDVISSWETRQLLSGFTIIHYPGGSHRFDHIQDSLQDIKEYLNHCSYVSDLNV